ncbi:MAG: ROK family transcriptional regulator [Clostridiaceae bacterium]|nr:ROK family transcriptional regulator [Clostridiaceae bacterium]
MPNYSASNIDVKRVNRINVIKTILAHDKISQPDLTHKLALSWPTVLQNVKDLIDLGLVEEVGAFASTGGRRARAFAPVRDAKACVGIDVTQNHISLVLVNIAGDLIKYTRMKSAFSMDDDYLTDLGKAVTKFVEASGYDIENIVSAGISLPGIINSSGKYILYSHVLKLENTPASAFTRHIPFKCNMINDANAAGFAEMYGQPEKKNAVYVSLSNSVGGSILSTGAFYLGDNLRAGEIGHNTLYPEGRTCYCGKSGCLDAYCSSKVLTQYSDGDLAQFFGKLKAGDKALRQVWHQYLVDLSYAINSLRMIFDCDVIIGGYVGGYLEEYQYELEKLVSERNTFGYDASYVKICRYKLEASAVGAAFAEIDNFIRQI